MADRTFRDLVEVLPEMAKVVNMFKGDAAQQIALEALLESWTGVRTRDAAKGGGSGRKIEKKSARKPGVKRRTSSKPAGSRLSVVPDLNLRPKGKKSFRDFYAEKAPKTNEHCFAVILYYLTRILGLAEIGPDHIYSCFKDVKRRVPRDLPSALRVASTRHGWLDTSDTANLRLKIHGENFVEQDLPVKGGARKKAKKKALRRA